MPILNKRNYYKPFEYPWAYDLFKKHEKMHWLPEEVTLDTDVSDWNTKLTEEERSLLTQLFRFFTQADVDVAQGYIQKFMPLFGKKPELAMMMSSFAAREAIHIDAYSLLLETIGMPEIEYQAFQSFEEMKAKHEYLDNFQMRNPQEIAEALAVYSAFSEGMQLFSSFAILLNFSRFNKMKGMCTIIDWSVRDESVHVEGMLKVFREYVKENSDNIDFLTLEGSVTNIAKAMVNLEDQFIDLAFGLSKIEGLTKEEVKQYIRYTADTRLEQLGFNSVYKVENPLTWLDWILNGTEHTNFFEQRATDYSKGTLEGNWNTIQW